MASVSELQDTGVKVTRIGGRVGALIENVQLSGNLDSRTIAVIREAVLDHKLVFVRQQRGTPTEIEAFAELYGEPEAHPMRAPQGTERFGFEMDYSTEWRADHWHTDFSFRHEFTDGGILYPTKLPAFGGDTVWANTAAAYQSLPQSLREMADKLWAVHSSARSPQLMYADNTPEALEFHRQYNASVGSAARHPVVRVHPVTGERSLLLGNFVDVFEGFTRTATNALYEMLQFYILAPENTIRWQWQMGDVAIWDNRATQHYGVRDFRPEPRVMRRIQLKPSIPVGVDGTKSSPVAGRPSDRGERIS